MGFAPRRLCGRAYPEAACWSLRTIVISNGMELQNLPDRTLHDLLLAVFRLLLFDNCTLHKLLHLSSCNLSYGVKTGASGI
jgi:hypothetical protein